MRCPVRRLPTQVRNPPSTSVPTICRVLPILGTLRLFFSVSFTYLCSAQLFILSLKIDWSRFWCVSSSLPAASAVISGVPKLSKLIVLFFFFNIYTERRFDLETGDAASSLGHDLREVHRYRIAVMGTPCLYTTFSKTPFLHTPRNLK